MSAKLKLVSFAGGLFSFVILLVTLISFFNFKLASVNNHTLSLNNEAFLIANAVDQRIERYFDSLEVIAETPIVDETGDVDVNKLIAMAKYIEKHLDVMEVAIGLENGDTYRSNGQIPNFNAKAKSREWYTRIFSGEKNMITKPFVNVDGILNMALGVPIIHQNELVAALVIAMPVNSVTEFIENLTKKNQVFAAREDGFILAAKDPEDIGKNLYEFRPSYQQFQNKPRSSHYYHIDGEEYFVVNAEAETTGWTIWSWDKKKNIYAASNENLTSGIIVSIVLIIVTLGITYILVTKLMYVPIGGEPKEIESIVKTISKGDLSITVKTDGGETGIHAAILAMVTNLKLIIADINNAAEHINSSSALLSGTTSDVNQSSEDQMKRLEQASTAMNQMGVTVDEVARNATQALTSAQEANANSDTGLSVVNEMNQHITTLVNGIETVVETNNRLEQETQGIGSILEVIDGISEQTNLLALNAAIEAARAGEHGRGFSVVADEVRNLANRTKESTKEIQQMIDRLQNEAKRSVDLMSINLADAKNTSSKSENATSALRSIRDSVSVILDMNNQIATAAEQQSHVAEAINSNVIGINELAKSTFENSNNNSSIANELTAIAKSLKHSVSVFKL